VLEGLNTRLEALLILKESNSSDFLGSPAPDDFNPADKNSIF